MQCTVTQLRHYAHAKMRLGISVALFAIEKEATSRFLATLLLFFQKEISKLAVASGIPCLRCINEQRVSGSSSCMMECDDEDMNAVHFDSRLQTGPGQPTKTTNFTLQQNLQVRGDRTDSH